MSRDGTWSSARPALVALLRSPHFQWVDGGAAVPPSAVAALDHVLAEARYLGDVERLTALLDAWEARAAVPPASRDDRRVAAALPAARAIVTAARAAGNAAATRRSSREAGGTVARASHASRSAVMRSTSPR